MIDLTIQFLKRITKLTIKHKEGEGGLKHSPKRMNSQKSSKQHLMQFYICKIKHIKYTYEERAFHNQDKTQNISPWATGLHGTKAILL